MWWMLSVAFANPEAVQVQYTVRFDLDANGDRLCGLTGFCDCSATYAGAATRAVVDGDRVTYAGTWARTANTCHEDLAPWAPADGKAHHTLRVRDGKLAEWVVHADPANHAKRTQDIKASGQFWIDDIGQPWPAERMQAEQRDGDSIGGMMRIDAHHVLVIAPGAEAEPAEASAAPKPQAPAR